jgi:hypothetical protein
MLRYMLCGLMASNYHSDDKHNTSLNPSNDSQSVNSSTDEYDAYYILKEVSNLNLNADKDKEHEIAKKIKFRTINNLLEGYGFSSSSTTSKTQRETFTEKIITECNGEIIENFCGETTAEQTFVIVLQKTFKYEVRLILKIAEFDAKYSLDKREHVNLLIHKLDDLENSKKRYMEIKDLLSKNIYEIIKNINDNTNYKPIKQFLIQSYDFKLPSDVKDHPNLYLKPGDHILIDRGIIYHHAIYLGNNGTDSTNKVVHIYYDEEVSSGIPKILNSHVREDEWSRLYKDKVVKICVRNVLFKIKCRKEIILAARKALNSKKGEFNVITSNCHIFANFCINGFILSNEIEYRIGMIAYAFSRIIDMIGIGMIAYDYSAIFGKIIEEKEKREEINKISELNLLNRYSGYKQFETCSNVTIRIINSDSLHNLKNCNEAPSMMIKQGPYKETNTAIFLTANDIELINDCKKQIYGNIIYYDMQHLENGQAIVIILNKTIWYAVHIFMQTGEEKSSIEKKRLCGIFRSQPAKNYFFELRGKFAGEKGQEEAEKYFQVR